MTIESENFEGGNPVEKNALLARLALELAELTPEDMAELVNLLEPETRACIGQLLGNNEEIDGGA